MDAQVNVLVPKCLDTLLLSGSKLIPTLNP